MLNPEKNIYRFQIYRSEKKLQKLILLVIFKAFNVLSLKLPNISTQFPDCFGVVSKQRDIYIYV